jgi:hypothetical protein
MRGSGLVVENEFCGYLDPKDYISINEHHTCGLKKVMGSKEPRCAFSFYMGEDQIRFEYSRDSALHCPMFTTDSGEMERLISLLRGSRKPDQ